MKHAVLVGTLIGALVVPVISVSAQFAPPAAGASLGTVTLNRRVMADGKPLAPGTYQVRLTGETPKPGLGQSPDGERYIEFVRGGKVIAREVATVVPASEIAQIAKGARPPTGGARVELLKGNDYVRVWINRGGANYIINMPAAT
jgi:hypothetical protein